MATNQKMAFDMEFETIKDAKEYAGILNAPSTLKDNELYIVKGKKVYVVQ